MNRIHCPKCNKEIVFKETNDEGIVFCNYCGSKMRILVQLLSDDNTPINSYSLKYEDELLPLAIQIVRENNAASISILQRRLGISYPRASRLIDLLEKKGIIGPPQGSTPRKVF